jgi:hypothetical protein
MDLRYSGHDRSLLLTLHQNAMRVRLLCTMPDG